MVKYLNKINKTLEEQTKNINKKLKIHKDSEQEMELETEPETKICPYCLSEIKFKASRCPNCTSILDDVQEEIVGEQLQIEEK